MQGSETDLNGYNVDRSVGNDQSFVRVASSTRTINYIDRNVSDGVEYYYRISALDTAGNISEFSETISSTMKPDTVPPEVISLSHESGSIFGREARIGILAARFYDKRLIFICSPFSGDIETNAANALRYCDYVLNRGAVPFAPHLYFPQFQDYKL